MFMCTYSTKSTSRAHCVPDTVVDLREGGAQVFLSSSREFYSGTSEGASKEVCVRSKQVEAHCKDVTVTIALPQVFTFLSTGKNGPLISIKCICNVNMKNYFKNRHQG